jgi:cysteinyl-tRNA synthetase
MAGALLGEQFDIHAGGIDLIFPHHENEIAQSRCAHGTKVMANYWMHNGFLQVEGQKMSKSLGNFFTIQQLLSSEDFGDRTWEPQVLRLAMLRTHYRQPIDWTLQSLKDAEIALDSWMNAIRGVEASEPTEAILESLKDDLNTHLAATEMYRLYRQKEFSALAASLAFLGFTSDAYKSGVSRSVDKALRQHIVRLVEDRLLARHNKDWKESDRIRDELAAMGISIKDNKDGTTTWEVKR